MQADILIVDDQDDIRMLIEGILEDEGFSTRAAKDSQTAMKLIAEREPELLVLDIWLENSDMDGMEMLKKLVRSNPDMPVIMISGHGNIETAVTAIQIGAYDFIEKPFKADKLLVLTRNAIEAARLKKENQELRLKALGSVSELHGTSAVMQQLKQGIERVAPTNSRVLITGLPGTGKNVAARMIHTLSKRADKNYLALNCAVLSPDRIELELFGAEGGMNGRKEGVLEQANGGTLFLDEVADMPLETQAKIVRVLQDQHFTRIGGTERVEVDVRIVASTAQDLQELMAQEKFRQDLYYRLNVVPIVIPALQERLEDIPLLARFFMELAARTADATPRRFADDAMALMQSYDWPGNVRQLRNVIEWLLIMAPGDASEPITADMLPPDLKQQAVEMIRGREGVELMSKPLREAREIFEREYLLSQVNRFGGNISKTAGFIGMERSALHRKLKSLGIQTGEKERAEG
ncbi:MAG: sigma-54-dependent Fis family transcriptional regulator [Alphaproteobacteria bacterium]|nr:MAG: sigma-54-dependent Fis family transcriptional regulator [Alphaproteobacteria bacterium]